MKTHIHKISSRAYVVVNKNGEPIYVNVYCKKCRVGFGFNLFNQKKFLNEVKCYGQRETRRHDGKGFVPSFPTRLPYGESMLKVKRETNTKFWLEWLDEQRQKAFNLPE